METKILKLLVILGTALTGHNAYEDYCDIKCSGHPHVLCNKDFPPKGLEGCKEYVTGISEEEIDAIVHYHNHVRQQIIEGAEKNAPRGGNMLVLGWDKELQTIAQRWADQCTQKEYHNECRILLSGQATGENLIVSPSSGPPDSEHKASKGDNVKGFMIRKWYSHQHESVNERLIKSYYKFRSSSDNYIQMIWAETNKIGCGISVLNHPANQDFKLVCNYAPTGLVEGAAIYKTGAPCAKCPKGSKCSRSWPGLCTFNESDFDKRLIGSAKNLETNGFLLLLISIFKYLFR